MNNENENENTNILVVSTVLGLLAWVLALTKLVKMNENTVRVDHTSNKVEGGLTVRLVTMTWQAARAAQTTAKTEMANLVAAFKAPAQAMAFSVHRHAKVLAKLAHRLKDEGGRFAEMHIRLETVASGATVLELVGAKVPQISLEGLKNAGDRLRKYKGFSMKHYSEFVFIVNALVYTGQISRGEAKNQMNLIACVKKQKEGQAVKNHDRPDYLLTYDEAKDSVTMESLPTEVALVNAEGIEIYPSKFEAWLASYLKGHQVDQEGRENRSGSRARTTWMKSAKLTWKFSSRYKVELPAEMRDTGWKPAGELGEFVRMCIDQGCFKDKQDLGFEFQIMHGLRIEQRGVNEVPDVLFGENRWTLWGLITSMTNPAAWLESAKKMNANITDDRLDKLPNLSLKRFLRGDETEHEGLDDEQMQMAAMVAEEWGCDDGFPKVRTPLAVSVCVNDQHEAMNAVTNMATHPDGTVYNWWWKGRVNAEYLAVPDAQRHPKHGSTMIAEMMEIDGEEFPVFGCVQRADEKKESRGGSHKGKGRNRGRKPRKTA